MPADHTTIQWSEIRHAIVFGLGVLVIVDALRGNGDPWPALGIGALMVGVLPIDRTVLTLRRGKGGRGRYRPSDTECARKSDE